MLVEPDRTPYDLRFRFLGFPVRVHPWFWIATLLLNGDPLLRRGPEYLFLWIGIVFVSILVHELGHAFAFRRLRGGFAASSSTRSAGWRSRIRLSLGRWRRILVSLAGPFAGFVLAGIIYGTNEAFAWGQDAAGAPNGPELRFFYRQMIWVNLIWGLFNLLPVFPLDGGQVCHELCGMKWGTRGKRVSLRISFVVALLMVAYSLLCAIDSGQFGAQITGQFPWWLPRGSIFTAILFGFLAYESYRLLQRITWTDTHWDDKLPWEK